MTELPQALGPLVPAALAAGLHGLRVLPTAMLCPFLGGPLVPAPVRISLAFGLGACAWGASGGAPFPGDAAMLAAAAARELALGAALGLLASVPFEAARAGGRLADTLRGATLAELHVAQIRQRESATGDLLVQWLLVLAGSAGGDRLVVAALLDTFTAVPAGAGWPAGSAGLLRAGLSGASELLACALALGAPAAAGVLAADLALALAARAAPQLSIASAAQPARAALGLAAIAIPAAALAGRLTSSVALSAGLVRAAAGSP